ncbi:MAG: hypothetical protein ACI4V1_03230 [Eubacteriales bacterium]
MNLKITFSSPEQGIFTPDFPTDKPEQLVSSAPINGYHGYLRPDQDRAARELGEECVREIKENILADFEKNEEYCKNHPEDHVDRMVHVSTFAMIDGVIYMTYYANTGTTAEDPSMQEARFAFCPCENPSDMTILRLLKAGDLLDGKRIDRVYDTILLHRDDDVLYLMWTASADGLYYRFYCTYTISTATLSPIRPNRFRVGEVTNDFSIRGMVSALSENGIAHKAMWSDIGIMQKLSTREENGETWYYTGAYSGNFNCIIKSRDFVTWEYVSAPGFINESLWENAVYVLDDKCYYFVRQDECMQGFLTCYDLTNKTWAVPCLIRDAQSRSDFIWYQDELYLIHAPKDRCGFGIVKIDREDLSQSRPVLVADMHDSLFYPYTDVYGKYAYMSYTVDRKHIRLTRFCLDRYLATPENERK